MWTGQFLKLSFPKLWAGKIKTASFPFCEQKLKTAAHIFAFIALSQVVDTVIKRSV
jgi:hypothetical protein